MKKLLIGNAAVARGLTKRASEWAAAYPGLPARKLPKNLQNTIIYTPNGRPTKR
jgi:TPP-dependent indolepyruvate ferredoxin oxidoreductase alpha subunit